MKSTCLGQPNYYERIMHVEEVTQSVYSLRLGTTVVIRVTLSPSSLLSCSPLIFFLYLTALALMEFGLDLRGKERRRQGRRKRGKNEGTSRIEGRKNQSCEY